MSRQDSLFLRACRGENTPVKPVWMMRQAGRYLPEYRAVRSRFKNFLEFVANADAAAEVTVQPIGRFGFDAAILFSDILVGVRPMGLDLVFEEQKGPQVSDPVRGMRDVERLRPVSIAQDLCYTREAIEKTRKLLPESTPLLGFVGGPFTVASYLVEGKGSKELKETKKLMHGDSLAWHALLQRQSDFLADYLVAQANWGCDALVIMDSWAGYLSPDDYRRFALPYTRQLVAAVRNLGGKPVIHYANGAGHLLKDVLDLGCHAVGLDWRTPLAEAQQLAPRQVFQGNLDPCMLYAPPAQVEAATRALVQSTSHRAHIVNLGHGVLPDVPIAGVEAFIRGVRQN